MELEEQFRVILKAAKIRAAIDKVREEKNKVVKEQRFVDAAALRDKEVLLFKKLQEIDKELLEIYKKHFPEESDEIDQIMI